MSDRLTFYQQKKRKTQQTHSAPPLSPSVLHPDLLSLDPDPLSLDLDLQKVVQLCDLKKVNRELWIPSFQRKDFAAAVIRHWVFIGGKQTHSTNARAENNF